MKEVVERLWELQSVMSHLTEQEKRLIEKPESFAAIDAEYQAVRQQIELLEERMEQLAENRRKAERDLQGQQETLKKYQGQLMQVKNQQQYAAAWKEIDATRKRVKELEDALLAQMTDIEETQQGLDEQRMSFDPLKARYDGAYEAWQHSLSDLRTDIEKTRGKVEGIESGIPKPIRAEFHRIFDRRQGLAVAEVVNNTCSACHTRVRPQATQQLKRGELVMCETCSRFYYLAGVNA